MAVQPGVDVFVRVNDERSWVLGCVRERVSAGRFPQCARMPPRLCTEAHHCLRLSRREGACASFAVSCDGPRLTQNVCAQTEKGVVVDVTPACEGGEVQSITVSLATERDGSELANVKLVNTDYARFATENRGAVDDLVSLTHLHEPAILDVLSIRFMNQCICECLRPAWCAPVRWKGAQRGRREGQRVHWLYRGAPSRALSPPPPPIP
jgi:hypothetical protein